MSTRGTNVTYNAHGASNRATAARASRQTPRLPRVTIPAEARQAIEAQIQRVAPKSRAEATRMRTTLERGWQERTAEEQYQSAWQTLQAAMRETAKGTPDTALADQRIATMNTAFAAWDKARATAQAYRDAAYEQRAGLTPEQHAAQRARAQQFLDETRAIQARIRALASPETASKTATTRSRVIGSRASLKPRTKLEQAQYDEAHAHPGSPERAAAHARLLDLASTPAALRAVTQADLAWQRAVAAESEQQDRHNHGYSNWTELNAARKAANDARNALTDATQAFHRKYGVMALEAMQRAGQRRVAAKQAAAAKRSVTQRESVRARGEALVKAAQEAPVKAVSMRRYEPTASVRAQATRLRDAWQKAADRMSETELTATEHANYQRRFDQWVRDKGNRRFGQQLLANPANSGAGRTYAPGTQARQELERQMASLEKRIASFDRLASETHARTDAPAHAALKAQEAFRKYAMSAVALAPVKRAIADAQSAREAHHAASRAYLSSRPSGIKGYQLAAKTLRAAKAADAAEARIQSAKNAYSALYGWSYDTAAKAAAARAALGVSA